MSKDLKRRLAEIVFEYMFTARAATPKTMSRPHLVKGAQACVEDLQREIIKSINPRNWFSHE